MPLDEAALAKAMFIEYYLPIDPPGTGSSSPEFAKQGRGIRWGQDVRFDADGNVWLTDRGYPHRLVKLNPRTGEQKDYLYPDGAKLGNHDLTIDRFGIVWAPEHSGVQPTGKKRILGFNPKTEKWEYQIPGDPDNVIRNEMKWMQSMALDSKSNLYVGWIMGGAISKWERATNKVTVYPISDRGAVPYGVIADRNDNIWIALWNSGKIAKFDTINEQWTEFAPLTFPGHIRRLNVDAQNNIWAAIWNQGRRPGKLAKLDQATGRFTEYSVPLWTAQPYDVNADPEGNIWFADSPTPDRVALINKFNPRNQTWAFYPKPQFDADTPKVQVTREGAIWYSPRGSRDDAGDWCPLSGYGQDHDPRSLLSVRASRESVAIADHADGQSDGQSVIGNSPGGSEGIRPTGSSPVGTSGSPQESFWSVSSWARPPLARRHKLLKENVPSRTGSTPRNRPDAEGIITGSGACCVTWITDRDTRQCL